MPLYTPAPHKKNDSIESYLILTSKKYVAINYLIEHPYIYQVAKWTGSNLVDRQVTRII